MTVLGAIFCVAYALAAIKGRRGVLIVLAASIGFNDSAAVVIGSFAVTPYYTGLLLYLALSAFGRSMRTQTLASRAETGILVALVVYSTTVTAFSPTIFAGLGVISSSIGLDEQVGSLSALEPSSSNVAQVVYLVLNALFFWSVSRSQQVTHRVVAVGFAVGSLVATTALIFQRVGMTWPSALFDNSPRGFYALGPDRLRAQFSEPSHLGAFSLAASAYFLVRLMQAKSPRQTLIHTGLLAVSAAPFAASASGTGLAGAAIGGAVVVAVGALRSLPVLPRLRVPVPAVLLGLVGTVALAFLIPSVLASAQRILDAKQGTTSQINRAYSNANGLDVMSSTFGFGAGLGSNRTSSLFVLLLSQIGVVGTGLFFGVVIVLIVRALKFGPTHLASVVALVAFLASAVVSLADFSSPVLWMLMAALASDNLRQHKLEPAVDGNQSVRSNLDAPGRQNTLPQLP